MPWTKITRVEHQRNGLRYASDLTSPSASLPKAKRFLRQIVGNKAQ